MAKKTKKKVAGATSIEVLSVDLGKTVGWARTSFDRHFGFAVSTTVGQEEFVGEKGDIYIAFMRWFDVALDGISVVCLEDVRFNRNFSYIPFQIGYLEAVCYLRNIAYVGVNVATLKAWATGSGNASKEKMMKAATKKAQETLDLIIDPVLLTDNVADAVLVLCWMLDHDIILYSS